MEFLMRLREFTFECQRVLRLTKKPTNEELQVIVKVAGLGILLIGFIGFIMQLITVVFNI